MQFRRGLGAMRRLGWLFAAIGGLVVPALQAAQTLGAGDSQPRILYFEPLPTLRAWADEQSRTARTDLPGSKAAKAQDFGNSPGAHRLSFDAYGRRFDLLLETNFRLNEMLQAKSLPASLGLYRGTLEGSTGSWVRLTAVEGQLHGMIWDGSELYVLEPYGASDVSLAASSSEAGEAYEPAVPVIFRLADVLVTPGSASCAVNPEFDATDGIAVDPASLDERFAQEALDGADPNASSSATRGDVAYGALLRELKGSAAIMQAAGATRRLALAVLGDAGFLQRYLERGLDAQAARTAILARMNNVDGIYSSQLGIELRVDVVAIDNALGSMLPDPVVAGSLLNELGGLRASSAVHRSLGLTHLFTGRDLEGSTVGIAYQNSLCSSRYGVGLTQVQGTAWVETYWLDALVAAHEIGHNFGAPHDGDPNAACGDAPSDHLMATMINGSSNFSECSLAQMRQRAQTASCIGMLRPANISIARDLGTVQQPVSQPFKWQFEISNTGGLVAPDVSVAVIMPPTMVIDQVTVIGGSSSCISSAGQIQCQIGNVPGGTSLSVVLDLRSDTPGSHSVSARVEAGQDEQSWDNVGDGTIMIIMNDAPVSHAWTDSDSGGGGSMSIPFLLGLLGALGLRRNGSLQRNRACRTSQRCGGLLKPRRRIPFG